MNKLNRSLILLAGIVATILAAGCNADGPPADPAAPPIVKTEQLSTQERIDRVNSSSLPAAIKQQKIDEIKNGKGAGQK